MAETHQSVTDDLYTNFMYWCNSTHIQTQVQYLLHAGLFTMLAYLYMYVPWVSSQLQTCMET